MDKDLAAIFLFPHPDLSPVKNKRRNRGTKLLRFASDVGARARTQVSYFYPHVYPPNCPTCLAYKM